MSMSMDTNANDQPVMTDNISSPQTPKRYAAVKAPSHHWDLEGARENLRNATSILSQRGLKLASRWAAEQLNGLAPSPSPDQPSPSMGMLHGAGNDLELYAKSIFDLGEFHRAAAILSLNPTEGEVFKPSGKRRVETKGGDLTILPPRNSLTSFGIYLRAYALFMAGEKRKEEEVLELR